MLQAEGKWYLGLTLAVSIGIHVLIGVYLSSVTISDSLQVTDLTFQDDSEPPSRSIPRPRPMLKEIPKLEDIKDLHEVRISQRPIPHPSPITTEPRQGTAGSGGATFAGMTAAGGVGGEKIEVPVVPGVPFTRAGLSIGDWTPKDLRQVGEFTREYSTKESYYEMVRLKIEKSKEYPDKAKRSQIQGRVTVQFIIAMTGELQKAQVVKSSQHPLLDEAAIRAVKNAAPFPRPPAQLFKEDILTTVTVVFELM